MIPVETVHFPNGRTARVVPSRTGWSTGCAPSAPSAAIPPSSWLATTPTPTSTSWTCPRTACAGSSPNSVAFVQTSAAENTGLDGYVLHP